MKLLVNWVIPILCALYLSLVIGQHFTPTAFRYLFLGFLFLFIIQFYVKTFIEKHKGEPINKKGIITSIILSVLIIYAGDRYLVPEIIKSQKVADITITALGKKNEKSSAYEVWLTGIKNDGAVDLKTLRLDSGWKRNENSLYAAEKFPATLHLHFEYVSNNTSLVFLKHSWSGMMQITSGKQQDVIDLFADPQTEFKYAVDEKQARVVHDSPVVHIIGYIIAFLFYAIIFYLLFVDIGGGKRKAFFL